MIEIGKRAYMLFDGDCGICTWFADLAMRTDVSRCFYVEPYQSVPEPEIQQFGLRHADCARKLRVITRRGTVHSGAFAVNYFFIHYFPLEPAGGTAVCADTSLAIGNHRIRTGGQKPNTPVPLAGNEGLPRAEIAPTRGGKYDSGFLRLQSRRPSRLANPRACKQNPSSSGRPTSFFQSRASYWGLTLEGRGTNAQRACALNSKNLHRFV